MSSVSEGATESGSAARTKTKADEAMSAAQQAAMSAAETARRTAEDLATRTAEAGREAGNAVQEVAGNFRDAVERSVERQPLTTVLLAVAVGVVLGGLMRR